MWFRGVALTVVVWCGTGSVIAADEVPAAAPGDDAPVPLQVTVGKTWTQLFRASRRYQGVRPLAPNLPVKALDELQLTGPGQGHKYVLGQFAADGKWGTVDGAIQLVEGRNGALKLGTAKDFELDATLELGELGGWFMLVGWNEGRGYSIINIGFRESTSPWFITEYRGNSAILEAHQEVGKFEWRRDQTMRLTVKDQELNLEVGKVKVLDRQTLSNYDTGDVILGVYDTNYGPRPMRILSLRMRALD
jgi:hypothetical protein